MHNSRDYEHSFDGHVSRPWKPRQHEELMDGPDHGLLVHFGFRAFDIGGSLHADQKFLLGPPAPCRPWRSTDLAKLRSLGQKLWSSFPLEAGEKPLIIPCRLASAVARLAGIHTRVTNG